MKNNNKLCRNKLKNQEFSNIKLKLFLNITLSFLLFNSCQQEEVTPTTNNPISSVSDIDGNQYNTVQIGSQIWMAENLRTTKFCNGDPIPNVVNDSIWKNLTTGAWAHYDNDDQYDIPYGKFYNWYAVSDERNICPCGWHVPTDEEWNTLINSLDPNADGGEQVPNVAGGKMKTTGNSHWDEPNQGATNQSSFSAVAAGFRNDLGTFMSMGYGTGFWTSTMKSTNSVWSRDIVHNNSSAYRNHFIKRDAISVRCIKD